MKKLKAIPKLNKKIVLVVINEKCVWDEWKKFYISMLSIG